MDHSNTVKQLKQALVQVQRALAESEANDQLLLKRAERIEGKVRHDLAAVERGMRTARDAYQEQGFAGLYQDLLGDLNRVLSVQKTVRHWLLLRARQQARALIPGSAKARRRGNRP
jgi:hypothetical protein